MLYYSALGKEIFPGSNDTTFLSQDALMGSDKPVPLFQTGTCGGGKSRAVLSPGGAFASSEAHSSLSVPQCPLTQSPDSP